MPIANTSGNNAQRIKKVAQTITLIQNGRELSARELADLMHCSDSTMKGYLLALVDGEIVTKRLDKVIRQHPCMRYTVIAGDVQIAAFLESLKFDPKKTCQPPPKQTQEERMAKDPSRRFHVLNDDEPVKVRVSRMRIPAPDPLLAQFFGMAGAAA